MALTQEALNEAKLAEAKITSAYAPCHTKYSYLLPKKYTEKSE